MVHESNQKLISQISLPGGMYYIHDAGAVHSLADLGLEKALRFIGVVENYNDLPSSGNKVGDTYHVSSSQAEYVWIEKSGVGSWEIFTDKFVVDHIHDVQITGTNSSSTVSASGTVNVPTVSESAVYTKLTTGSADFVTSYPGATSKMVTTSITPAGATTSVINKVEAATTTVTGVSGSTTASKVASTTDIEVAKAGTAKSIPNVTSAGSASTWSFTISGEVLTISGANSVAPTLGTAISVTPAVSNGKIHSYTFTDVTVPKAATTATTVVTGVTTDNTNVATQGTAKTVATGALSSTGGGATVMTGLGTASTTKALTSASLSNGTSGNGVYTGDNVTIGSVDKTVNVSGTAAAQTWNMTNGTTGAPKEDKN